MVDHDDSIINLETHHEKSDVDVRALLWFVVIFIVFAALTHLLLYMMFRYFVVLSRGATNAPLTSIARPADAAIPQQPRLQPFPNKERDGTTVAPNALTPEVDMVLMRRDQDQALRTPAMMDRQKGTVRIPIEVAKQLIVQRGLPVVKP